MAILTSKGVKASHQLRGVRKVRINRDRRGAGSGEQAEIKSLDERMTEAEDNIGDLKTTATQAQATATQAQTTATQAQTTASFAASDVKVARDEIGDITALETSDTSDLTSAINELVHRISALES